MQKEKVGEEILEMVIKEMVKGIMVGESKQKGDVWLQRDLEA